MLTRWRCWNNVGLYGSPKRIWRCHRLPNRGAHTESTACACNETMSLVWSNVHQVPNASYCLRYRLADLLPILIRTSSALSSPRTSSTNLKHVGLVLRPNKHYWHGRAGLLVENFGFSHLSVRWDMINLNMIHTRSIYLLGIDARNVGELRAQIMCQALE